MKEFKYKEITEKIIGAAMKVHSTLGNGFSGSHLSKGISIANASRGAGFSKRVQYDHILFGNSNWGKKS